MRYAETKRTTVIEGDICYAPDFVGFTGVKAIRPTHFKITYWQHESTPDRNQVRVDFSGQQIKKDGTVGAVAATAMVDPFEPIPTWVQDIIDAMAPEGFTYTPR